MLANVADGSTPDHLLGGPRVRFCPVQTWSARWPPLVKDVRAARFARAPAPQPRRQSTRRAASAERRGSAASPGSSPGRPWRAEPPHILRCRSKNSASVRLRTCRRIGFGQQCANSCREHVQQTTSYSITASARCWRNIGTSRPSVLAVLRLTVSSNLTGAWIGSSLGFSPLRMRST
jgi:hypothetical protein